MVNQALSLLSDYAFQATMAAYLVALVCYGVEYASRRAVTPGATLTASFTGSGAHDSGREQVTRRAPAGYDGSAYGWVEHLPRSGWGERFGRAATGVTFVGFNLQLASLISRGWAVGRVPWGNMYEFASMITAAAVGCWLFISARSGLRNAGFFFMLPVTVLVFLAGTVLYTRAVSLVPALQSYWLVVHVLAVSLSSGVLLVSGSASVMYLIRSRPARRPHPAAPQTAVPQTASRSSRLPSLEALDRVAYRTAIVAFPVYTFAVIAGAMWAESAWGRYWGWDPKETCAFITWMLYAGYLHARATAGWRGRRAAWIAVAGTVSILFNLFFINMVIAGLHSYAGLN